MFLHVAETHTPLPYGKNEWDQMSDLEKRRAIRDAMGDCDTWVNSDAH